MEKQENYMEKEIKKFTDEMEKSYEEDNIIRDFCTINETLDPKKEFIQVGQRTNLPKEFFQKEEGVHKDISNIARDFIRSLVNGEKYFVLREIMDSPVIEKSSISNFDFSELCKIALSIRDASHIFLPIEPFFMKVHHLAFEMPKNFEFVHGVGLVLKIGGRKIKIDWITTKGKVEKIIVLNKGEINVKQKTYDGVEFPKGLIYKKEYEEFNSGEKVMVYFGEKDAENFGFVFRTIISKPELNTDSAKVISYPEKL